MPAADGMTFKETVDTLASFLEVVIHTLLCLRAVYPASTFSRARAHGVAVYQSRSPAVRAYVAAQVRALSAVMERGALRRMTLATRDAASGVPLERFIVDFGYLAPIPDSHVKITGAPGQDALSASLRAFLVRLAALDGQLQDAPGESTFSIVIETSDDAAVDTATWVPALAGDALTPHATEGHDEPLLSVRAVETGVIDLRMLVQECSGKASVTQLHRTPATTA